MSKWITARRERVVRGPGLESQGNSKSQYSRISVEEPSLLVAQGFEMRSALADVGHQAGAYRWDLSREASLNWNGACSNESLRR